MNLASKESPQSESSAQQPVRVQTEYSRALGDWLISQQVALVCSTYLAGYLLFIGVRSDGLGAKQPVIDPVIWRRRSGPLGNGR